MNNIIKNTNKCKEKRISMTEIKSIQNQNTNKQLNQEIVEEITKRVGSVGLMLFRFHAQQIEVDVKMSEI